MRRLGSGWVALALLAASCGGGASSPEAPVWRLAEALEGRQVPAEGSPHGPGWRFGLPAASAAVTVDRVRRQAVVLPGGWRWRGEVPRRARLTFSVAATESAPALQGTLRVTVRAGERERLRVEQPFSSGDGWQPFALDLAPLGGEEAELAAEVTTLAAAPPPFAWAEVVLAAPRPRSRQRPNLVLIVVDTLRADHTSVYGYRRDTTPGIARTLARRGVVFERAYAQAPWTLPSAASYFTGLYPGEFLAEESGAFALPAHPPSLPERLSALGYRTAGFIANPTLYEGNGFARGFETFYTPAYEVASLTLHAPELQRRVRDWLAALPEERPFFLYLHYLDPHDPYENDDLVDGRSSFYPDYRGSLRGGDVHALYSGDRTFADPADDLAQLVALYDNEVRYVDRFVADLVESLPAERAAETLFVLTSDHGEELFERGGFKHGQTLYEEQIRVPLIARWDGVLAPGRRSETALLVDLVPTLVAAAGGGAVAGDGIDLLGPLSRGQPLPRRSVEARHHGAGPLRAATAADGWKLMLFNDADRRVPADPLQAKLALRDRARLHRLELYDLAADPLERRNLASAQPERLAALLAQIERRLDRELAGLRLATEGLAPSTRLRLRLHCAEAPRTVLPLWLAGADRFEVRGSEIELECDGEPLGKGLVIDGCESLIGAELTALAGPAPALLLGAGRTYAGGPIRRDELLAERRSVASGLAQVRLWLRAPDRPRPTLPEEETVKRLRALGYVQ